MYAVNILYIPSSIIILFVCQILLYISPPARWGLLDFMSVACSSSPLISSPSSPPPLLSSSSCSTATLDHSGLCRTSTTTILLSVPCRTSTTTITASVPCRTSTTAITASVPCRTSTAGIPAQCSLPDLNHDHPRPVFPAGPQPRVSMPSVPCRTSCRKIWDKECAEES